MLNLDQSGFSKIQPWLEALPFNTYFARAVLKNTLQGTVLVDDAMQPQSALIFHPYGMLLLCGRADNDLFNRGVADFLLNTSYPRVRWLQVSSAEWSRRLEDLLGSRLRPYPQGMPHSEAEQEFQRLNRDNVVECTRVNFKFQPDNYPKSEAAAIPAGLRIRRMNKELFENTCGTVIARYFWNGYADFAARGAGFCLMQGQTILSACFTAFVFDKVFEVGIETHPDFRGRGYARLVARAFIDHCQANGLEPVWGCRKENVGSFKLAQELGFEAVRELPYYALVNNSQQCQKAKVKSQK